MDPVTQTAAALLTGRGDTAQQAVKDSYQALKRLLSTRFAGRRSAELVLAGHGGDPGTWRAPLEKALQETGATTDPEVLAAAQAVLGEADTAGMQAGKYRMADLRGASGMQVGDRNRQVNTFGPAPER